MIHFLVGDLINELSPTVSHIRRDINYTRNKARRTTWVLISSNTIKKNIICRASNAHVTKEQINARLRDRARISKRPVAKLRRTPPHIALEMKKANPMHRLCSCTRGKFMLILWESLLWVSIPSVIFIPLCCSAASFCTERRICEMAPEIAASDACLIRRRHTADATRGAVKL